MKRLVLIVSLVTASCSAPSASDLKIVKTFHYNRIHSNRTDSNGFPDQNYRRTEKVFISGPHRRYEAGDYVPPEAAASSGALAHVVTIEDCQKREIFTIDAGAHEYVRLELPSDEAMKSASE